MVYSCIVRVRHASPLGAAYTRTHVVVVRTSLQDAVSGCGARTVGWPYLDMKLPMPEICYEECPVCVDPAYVVLELPGLEGSVHVPLPYQCTYEHMTAHVIPAKLLSLGLPCDGELRATGRDMQTPGPLPYWTRARCRWPAQVLRGVTQLQRLWRASGYVLV